MNPFTVRTPACVSFSGGRTSGYMLYQILQAYGGHLPEGIHVVFADTGKEHPGTYDFVEECSKRWAVKIEWLSMDYQGFETPFDALIEKKKYLPNPRTRFCTEFLKVRPIKKFMINQGYDRWQNVVGLRADEPNRVKKLLYRCEKYYSNSAPLWEAGITKSDILSWWSQQDFDLRIPAGCGNCIGCFMKGKNTLIAIEQRDPGSLKWWAEKEQKSAATFHPKHRRMTYAEIIDVADRQGNFLIEGSDESISCSCTD